MCIRSLLTTLLAWIPLIASAADVEIGQTVPDFALQGEGGVQHRLSDYQGRGLVVAWFPKAFTPG
jgi:peroxiredoxin